MNKFSRLFYIGLTIFVFPLVIMGIVFLGSFIESASPKVEKIIHYDTIKVQIPVHVYDTIKIEKIITKTKYIENDTTNTSN